MNKEKSISHTSTTKLAFTFLPSLILRSLYFTGRMVKILLLLLALTLLLFYGLTFIPDASSYEFTQFLLELESGFRAFYTPYLNKLNLPEVNGQSIPQIVTIVTIFLLSWLAGVLTRSLGHYADALSFKKSFNQWKKRPTPKKNKEEPSAGNEDLKKIVGDGKMGRQELLDLFGQVQRNLEAMKKDLTFVSIDVIDSTSMKEGEDTTDVELDFKRYNQLLKDSFKRNGYLKAAWTPDGVMSCFETADKAVTAARQILYDLKAFNKNDRTIKSEFTVRCGINSGKVAYDDNSPLENLCDHVLDIAGHFQKHGLPNVICISKHTYERMSYSSAFKNADKKIDGIEMYINKYY
ncbi:MAG: hypothetical protein ACE5DY_04160 [Mariprofundaceae bacterium]